MDGDNFTSDAGRAKRNPRRPTKVFVFDERPPPILSLNFLRMQTWFKYGVIGCAIYVVVDACRTAIYRSAPTTVPLQPSPLSTVVSTSSVLAVPCHRFAGCDLVMTEAAVADDTAPYLPTQGSTSLRHDLPHHKPRRSIPDRLLEIRDAFGYVADLAASSIVFLGGGEAPHVFATTPPPRAVPESLDGVVTPAALSVAFDMPPSGWPTDNERAAVADQLTRAQQRRLAESNEDLWGRKNKGIPGVVSWTATRSDLARVRSSVDFGPVAPGGEGGSGAEDVDVRHVVRAPSSPPVRDVAELPRRDGMAPSAKRQAAAAAAAAAAANETGSSSNSASSDSAGVASATSSAPPPKPASGTALRDDTPNALNMEHHRFMSLQFRSRGDSGDSGRDRQYDGSRDAGPTELRVKCLDASAAGGTSSHCAVDSSVICAPRHRTMLAALAMLPDPLPTHLQIATFGVGPTIIAGFIFKFFAQHIKRLDVVTEPALLEHNGVLDFGLTSRAGPVHFFPADEEKFMLRSEVKYDILFVSACDPDTGRRAERLSSNYVSLVRKSLSAVGVAAFELKGADFASQRTVREIFGLKNVFVISVPRSDDVVMLAAYQLPREGVWKRHLLGRAEDISFTFRLPYDLGAHLPASWYIW